jgi:hypothetical protein
MLQNPAILPIKAHVVQRRLKRSKRRFGRPTFKEWEWDYPDRKVACFFRFLPDVVPLQPTHSNRPTRATGV